MAANKWKNSLKNVKSDNNKILYETLLDLFLQRNGAYFLNMPRIYWKFENNYVKWHVNEKPIQRIKECFKQDKFGF